MFNIATVPKSARQALSQDGLSLLNPTELTATLELGAGLGAGLECADAFVGPAAAGRAPEGRRALPQAAAFLLVQELATGTLVQTPHRAHWQPTDYNALHGGLSAGSTRWSRPWRRRRRGQT
jgi:hypothetical protein